MSMINYCLNENNQIKSTFWLVNLVFFWKSHFVFMIYSSHICLSHHNSQTDIMKWLIPCQIRKALCHSLLSYNISNCVILTCSIYLNYINLTLVTWQKNLLWPNFLTLQQRFYAHMLVTSDNVFRLVFSY